MKLFYLHCVNSTVIKYLIFFVPLFIGSCKSIDIEQPLINESDPLIHQQKESTLHIPIEIGLQNQLKEVEKTLPLSFHGQDEQCEGISFSYKFIREPIRFHLNPASLDYEIDGKFELKLNYCPKCQELWTTKGTCIIPRLYASCGFEEPMRRVRIGYNTAISLTDQYAFHSDTKLTSFKIIDPCEISVFKYDATSQVEKQVIGELKALEKDIDKQIESINISSYIKEVWKQLEQPIDLSGYGLLYLKPNSLALSPVLLDEKNHQAHVTAQLGVKPVISTNKETLETHPLPKQSDYTNGQRFHLSTLVKASYDSINKRMNHELMGYKIPIKKRVLIIDSLFAIGNYEQKLIVKVYFSGSRKGVFYLSGSPLITEDQCVVLSNMEYDLNTKSILLKTARWLFDKRILELLTHASKFDLKPILNQTKTSITQNINTTIDDGIFLSGDIQNLSLYNLQLGTTGFFVDTEVSGNLKLKIK